MLELTALTKSYDEFAFGPLDLTVGDEVLSVLGPSGSGKTTLLSLISGIVTPDGGTVALNGTALDGKPIQERHTGLVFQDGALFPHLSARENVAYAAASPERVEELASLLEISSVLDRRPSTLSGGEQQRVALARTLAADPDALLLDEPLSSLDTPIRRRLRGELHDLFQSLDIPVVYVTHDQRTATAVGDRIAIFRDGAIEQVGSPTTVINRPATRFVAQFTGNENVFDGRVATGDNPGAGAVVELGELRLSTSATAAGAPGTAVTLCIHPSRIVASPVADTDSGNSAESVTENSEKATVVGGVVNSWLNEGTHYRVDITLDNAPVTLTTTVDFAVFDQLNSQRRVSMRIPADAIHLLD
jgi:molybdate/tungstate transport system ATP-binding protein